MGALALGILLGPLSVASAPAQIPLGWRIERIAFRGNVLLSDKDLQRALGLKRGDEYLEGRWEEAVRDLQEHYRSLGFLEANTTSGEKRLNGERRGVELEVVIYEGRRTYLRGIRVEGNTLFTAAQILSLIPLGRGEPLDRAHLDLLMTRVREKYAERGWAHCLAESRLETSSEGDSADVTIRVEEGRRAYVGGITVAGAERVGEELVWKGLTFTRGDVFTPQLLQQAQQSIYQTGVFKSVAFDVKGMDEKRDTLDVHVQVVEGPLRSLGFGTGYGSTDGIRGSLEWGQMNLWGRAEALSARGEVTFQPIEESAIDFTNSYALSLIQPYFLGTRTRATWTAAFRAFDYAAYNQESLSGNLVLSRLIGLYQRASLVLELNTVRIFDVDSSLSIPPSVRENVGRRTRNVLTWTYVLDKRQDLFYPTDKDVLTLKAGLAGGPLAGERDYYRIAADYARYWPVPLPLRTTVLGAHLKLGVARDFGRQGPVPPDEQFSVGGANTLRGYAEVSVGPSSLIAPREGNILIQASLELRYGLLGPLGGVFFIDAANVYDRDFETPGRFLLSSFGTGLRYQTPFGPLRLEGALRIDDRLRWLSGRGRIHVSVGQPF